MGCVRLKRSSDSSPRNDTWQTQAKRSKMYCAHPFHGVVHGDLAFLDADHQLNAFLVRHGDLARAQVALVLLVRVLTPRPTYPHVLEEPTQASLLSGIFACFWNAAKYVALHKWLSQNFCLFLLVFLFFGVCVCFFFLVSMKISSFEQCTFSSRTWKATVQILHNCSTFSSNFNVSISSVIQRENNPAYWADVMGRYHSQFTGLRGNVVCGVCTFARSFAGFFVFVFVLFFFFVVFDCLWTTLALKDAAETSPWKEKHSMRDALLFGGKRFAFQCWRITLEDVCIKIYCIWCRVIARISALETLRIDCVKILCVNGF